MMVAPPNFYRPERLDGEGFKTYRHRLKLGKQAATLGGLLDRHKATQARKMRRALVNSIGIRQAKKWLRHAKAARAQAAADSSSGPQPL
jgi:hypothetical protein